MSRSESNSQALFGRYSPPEEIFWRSRHKGVARWKGENFPRETEKIVVENGVISDGSIFSNKFSKIK